MQTVLRYPEKQLQAYFEGTFVNARNGAMIEFMGTEGSIYLDRGRYELHPEIKKQFGQEPSKPTLQYSEMVLEKAPEEQTSTNTLTEKHSISRIGWRQCEAERSQSRRLKQVSVRHPRRIWRILR